VREVELEEFTIEEKIELVNTSLGKSEQVLFADLFAGAGTRLELIVTLMALLELIKHGRVKARQDSSFGSIWIYRVEHYGKPMDASAEESEPEAGDGEGREVSDGGGA